MIWENIEQRQVKLWKQYEKYGRKVSWIVKKYKKYGRKASWRVKRYEKYGRKDRKIWKIRKKIVKR